MRTITDDIGNGPINITKISGTQWSDRHPTKARKYGIRGLDDKRVAVIGTYSFRSNPHPQSDGTDLGPCVNVVDNGPPENWRAKFTAANDNSIEWPLGRLLTLPSTGSPHERERWRVAAESYEALWSAANLPVRLSGVALEDDEGLRPEQSLWFDPDGEMHYKGARGLRAKSWFNPKTGAIQFKGHHQPSPTPQKWDGDRELIAKMDAEAVLHDMNEALGRHRVSVEDAAVHGLTMGAIGVKLGYSAKYGQTKAKQAVLAGLDIVAALSATVH